MVCNHEDKVEGKIGDVASETAKWHEGDSETRDTDDDRKSLESVKEDRSTMNMEKC